MSHTATPVAGRRPHGAAASPTASIGTLLVLLTGIFITTLDFFIVNVAIPDIQTDLRAGATAIQWVVAGFGLALGSGLITSGRLGDLAGRRRMYALGLAVFTAASLACGLAPSPGTLIAARVVQGLAAALLMPQVLGIINGVFTGEARAKAFTAYGLAMGLGGVFGQLIGGVLIQADLFGTGWRSIFLINVPVGVVTLALVRRTVPPQPRTTGTRLDVTGTVLVTLGLVALVLPLIEGRRLGWPAWTWASLAASAVLLAAFVVSQRRSSAPLVSPTLFREPAFRAGSGLALVYTLAMASFFLYLALYLQQGRGLSALESGLLFVALGAGYFAASTRATAIAARLGRQVLALGAAVQAAGCLLLLAATGHAIGWLIPGLALVGAGMGFVLAPLSALVLAGVTDRHAASAAGVLSTAQQVGNALGVALVGIVFYGALGEVADAFRASLFPVMAFCGVTAALAQLLPRR
ncbi:EmrB/QacA subfamily drug resistance transporter [Actinomadura coerulea]|uniref:EmrB/QacA subfamily drug resistance transporter n=1 Tax=Actinomadura coerulea TaxID=46159 RepID=A0A7X0L146_9ACTN|nr:MFS transporter [Actinomadura coerulea]MBB6398130.1 EmrB/QacA subfamily drug resistance transporter [Actinomadura coerulea]GGQ36053.1 MFS transporter [Actinomadura coerulea]